MLNATCQLDSHLLPNQTNQVIRPIRVGQELLLDYGPNYFSLGAYSQYAPPEPPGIDDPPEVIPAEGVMAGGEEEGEGDEESDV